MQQIEKDYDGWWHYATLYVFPSVISTVCTKEMESAQCTELLLSGKGVRFLCKKPNESETTATATKAQLATSHKWYFWRFGFIE